MAEERLQKILRSAGITSRRKAEALILAGRVRVDGQIVTELGSKANPRRAKVELDGQRVRAEPFCYGVMHKPRGMLSTLSDPEGRDTASSILRQVGVRVVPIGRLDFNTSGVLLFTNDGDFAQALSHASGKVPKVYAAKVQQTVDEATLAKWAEAIDIEGSMTRPANIRILRREGEKTWLEVTLVEGKNRQVRRLGDHAKTPVVRLSRLSHANITAEGLRPGQWRLLSVDELKTLKKQYGVPKKIHAQGEALAAWTPNKPTPSTKQAIATRTNRPSTAGHVGQTAESKNERAGKEGVGNKATARRATAPNVRGRSTESKRSSGESGRSRAGEARAGSRPNTRAGTTSRTSKTRPETTSRASKTSGASTTSRVKKMSGANTPSRASTGAGSTRQNEARRKKR